MGDLNAFYETCTCPDCVNMTKLAVSPPSEGWGEAFSKAFEHVLKGVHKGKIKETDLDNVLYNLTVQYLSGGAGAGFKDVGATMETATDQAMIAKIRKNISVFSGAKTYQQLRALNNLLLDGKGDLKSFNDFKADATRIYTTYNENWLRAEYNHAVASATSAARWQDYQADKEAAPNLEYSTVGDERVRSSHVLLDGIIRHIDDDFWKTHYPPNGWNCRCRALQTLTKETPLEGKEMPVLKEMFKGNVAIDGAMFPPNHPYFKVSATVRSLIDALVESKANIVNTEAEGEALYQNIKLTKDESRAILDYTDDYFIYINEHLRLGTEPTERTEHYLKKIPIISETLQKLPKYQNTVYRGIGVYDEASFEEMKAFYTNNDRMQDKGFVSTSTRREEGEGYQGLPYTVFMEIESTNGRYINPLSKWKDEEFEVLFDKGTTFAIISTEIQSKHIILKLKEL
jgi:SPP1 gp7 family putative phage head morphogenesis protein